MASAVWAALSDAVAKERRLNLEHGGGWAELYGRTGAAGKTVTQDTLLQLSAAWACIRTSSQAVGAFPGGVYQKTPGGGRKEAEGHELVPLLLGRPNATQTPLEFFEGLAAWLLSWGNAYALKETTGPRVSALYILPASQTTVRRTDEGLVYEWTDRGRKERAPADSVLHIRGWGFGGDVGLSPIRFGVQTFSSALATEEVAGKIFSNGMMPAGVLSSDHTLTDSQRAQLAEMLQGFVGSERAGKLMTLEAGLKYQQLSLNPEDAQMLETRRFAVEDICRWFGVPPIVIGHSGAGQTMWGSGVEQIMLAWLTLGLNPVLKRIEARIAHSLVPARDRGRVYFEFNREGLLQADSASKAAFLSTMVQNGLMSRNEARGKLNLAAAAGADALTAQTNLAPIEALGASQAGDARAALRAFLGMEGT